MSNDWNKTLDHKATKILALVHSDLAGPIQPLAKDYYKYVMNFIDDYSGLTMSYFLKHKSDTAHYNKISSNVKCLRTDNETKFTYGSFQQLPVLNRIKHKPSTPYSLHQNGTAEQSWQALFSMASCLLIKSKLPPNLWV